MTAFTASTFAFSGSLNLLRDLPWLLSNLCYLSFFSSISFFLSPLICNTFLSSNSTLTFSFLESREIRFEHMDILSLFPIEPRIQESRLKREEEKMALV
ncbi:hypothetical protein AMTR_s00108p00101480 [Amborella trichopoda]|uniref:Uncharacterized protein n=1 Tax=Amborella trichopoda TaxID=13333 RepID=W1NVH6_AMBTC|nr:hypothetical protein AMTR_s00108p00101480 [Amborella trichopoda]